MDSRLLGLDDFIMQDELFCQKGSNVWHFKSVLVIERSSALDSSSGVVKMWVRIPAWINGRGTCVLDQDT